MEKKEVQQVLHAIKTNSPKRKFTQSVDLIITLKDINLKQTENQIDLYVSLNYSTGKKRKVCALVGAELIEEAKKQCDYAILSDDFERFAQKKRDVKKLASSHDYFIAQANMMTTVAKFFGRVLGPKGKMPNPKAGCVVPANANLASLIEKLQKTVNLKAKTEYAVKVRVGTEAMPEEQVIDNIITIYNAISHALPNDKNNIKSIALKLTMGKPLYIGKEPETKTTKKNAHLKKETKETIAKETVNKESAEVEA